MIRTPSVGSFYSSSSDTPAAENASAIRSESPEQIPHVSLLGYPTSPSSSIHSDWSFDAGEDASQARHASALDSSIPIYNDTNTLEQDDEVEERRPNETSNSRELRLIGEHMERARMSGNPISIAAARAALGYEPRPYRLGTTVVIPETPVELRERLIRWHMAQERVAGRPTSISTARIHLMEYGGPGLPSVAQSLSRDPETSVEIRQLLIRWHMDREMLAGRPTSVASARAYLMEHGGIGLPPVAQSLSSHPRAQELRSEPPTLSEQPNIVRPESSIPPGRRHGRR